MHGRLTLLLAAAALAVPSGAQAAAPAVQPRDMAEHFAALAGIAAANGGNRAAGLPGAEATVGYLTTKLTEAGWQVRSEPVTFTFPFDRGPAQLAEFQQGRDFAVVRGSGAGDVTAPVRTILNERCDARALRRLRTGEIALLPFTRCSGVRAAQLVAQAGGTAVLFDSGPATFPLRYAMGGSARIPVLQVRSAVAVRLSRREGDVHLKTDSGTERRTAHNVIAELPGSDPRRVVMAGGHLDSVPEGPGVNDNGSGIAALLEAAERLPQERRKATIRLGFWTAEEYGLFGSSAYVRALPAAERKRIRAYMNFDMIGSPNGVVEVYDTDNAIERVLRRMHPGREREADLTGSSDQTSFEKARIPVGGIYTGALERRGRGYRDRCYHRPCDDADNPDAALAARIATTVERSLAELSR